MLHQQNIRKVSVPFYEQGTWDWGGAAEFLKKNKTLPSVSSVLLHICTCRQRIVNEQRTKYHYYLHISIHSMWLPGDHNYCIGKVQNYAQIMLKYAHSLMYLRDYIYWLHKVSTVSDSQDFHIPQRILKNMCIDQAMPTITAL